MQLSLMHVCKYLNQTVRRIGEQNRKSYKGVSKTKQTQLYEKCFITQFKIEFLLPFTGRRKVLGKVPVFLISFHKEFQLVKY